MSEPTPPACSEEGLPAPGPLTEDLVARIAKALAHPARVRIVEMFGEHRPLMVHEIVDNCALAQSTVSEHLRILREADLVIATLDGPRTWFCLRRSVLSLFAHAVEDLSRDVRLSAR